MGQSIIEKNIENIKTQSPYTIDIKGLPAGSYLVSMKSEGRQFCKILTIVK